MNTIGYIAAAMTLAGAATLLLSLAFASRIIAELPLGPLRFWWGVLRALIVVFVLGYGTAIWLLPDAAGLVHFVMGAVFLFGAAFVLLVCRLMLLTVVDVRRIAALELENVTDPLTGIYNRRYMEQRLREEVSRANRYDLPLTLLILDIDHFKRINDDFGRPIGDQMLKNLCEVLRGKVRDVDLFARYGGEEFVVILPNTNTPDALVLAERLRKAVEESTIVVESGGGRLELTCTVSVGLATAPGKKCDAKQLLREADHALYAAKAGGRNRVEAHKPEAKAA